MEKVFVITNKRKEYDNCFCREIEETFYIPYVKGAMRSFRKLFNFNPNPEDVWVTDYATACGLYPTAFPLWEDFEESDKKYFPCIMYTDVHYRYTKWFKEKYTGLVSDDSISGRCWIKL